MDTKTRQRKYEYRILASGKLKIVTARNIREAGAKARRLFPRAKFITVSRKPSRKGKDYETYSISR